MCVRHTLPNFIQVLNHQPSRHQRISNTTTMFSDIFINSLKCIYVHFLVSALCDIVDKDVFPDDCKYMYLLTSNYIVY